ncbi:vitamin K epoxide reductase family protein [Amycolatopsis palatopharyngis]|uniref:vitamin K epoxide reductase family protein n=1 Tax=Amycolatopsis palatopharyngis TaxID=187982 RepID=UPI00319E9455
MSTTGSVRTSSDREPSVSAAPRGLAWLYVIGGGAGFVAAFVLMLEKLAKLGNPAYVPTCTLNPVVSCGSVMDSPQASAFGFPNPLIGIGAFAVVVTVGVVLLSGFRAPRWFWLGMQAGTTFGVLFVHWLIYSSLYDIGALCPYCMVVWAVTIPIFWYTTLHNLTSGHFSSSGKPVALGLAHYHSLALVLWYLAIVALVLEAFWYYWSTLL